MTMKILVWKSYGDIRVYDVSTYEKLLGQIEKIIKCIDGWGMEEDVAVVRKKIEDHPDDYKQLVNAFGWLSDAINPASDNDAFEYLSIQEME